MSKIHVIRASAGSGKTHYLTGFFLNTIFKENKEYFKSILAVTFTNKATEEMKWRIIEQLNILQRGDPSDYLRLLQKKTGFTEKQIRGKSGSFLKKILHDYSWFNIETIDTFFQRIIRAFTREIGIPGNYSIEIETKPALEHAVDTLIDGIEDKTALLNWLIRFAEDKILEGKTWNVQADLLRLGQEIFKEDFAKNAKDILNILIEKESLEKFRKQLYTKVETIEKEVGELSETALSKINEKELDPVDFFQKGRGIIPYLLKLKNRKIDLPNSYVIKLLDGPEIWPAADSKNKEEVIYLATSTLLPLLIQIVDYLQSNLPIYFTAKEILKNYFSLGILSDISAKVIQYRHEKNTFILSDAPVFIHRIIDHNQTPFIYEKMGNRYHHFLIDEFQDTSGMQWENFRPLILNSLANGKECLLVGDVKQSIYRWRNSNWEILDSQIFDQFSKHQILTKNLDINYRSKEFVVSFNSDFFSSVNKVIQNQLSGIEMTGATTIPDFDSRLVSIYHDVKQDVPLRSKGKGSVEIRFFERGDIRDNQEYLEEIFLDQIKQLLDLGYSPGDIAILVRWKKEGQRLAELLIEKNTEGFFNNDVRIISNESLFLNASNAVNLLVAALQYLIHKEDEINCGKLINTYHVLRKSISNEDILPEIDWKYKSASDEGLRKHLPGKFFEELQKLSSMPLYDLVENLIRIFLLGTLQQEVPFLHAFLDLIHDFVQMNVSDTEKFLDYWKEEGMMKSVPATDAQNALRILTIHKSKGLEFKVVVIPYCNWSLDQKANNILWAKPSAEIFEFLPVYPIDYNKSLKKSFFADAYYTELFKSYVDNLNLLYVAFTRAIDALIVYSQISNTDRKKTQINNVGDILYQSIKSMDHDIIEEHFDNENKVYRYGVPLAYVKEVAKELKEEIIIKPSEGEPVTDRLFIHSGGYDFFCERQEQINQLSLKGTVLHAILSKIIKADEIESVISDAFYDGLITREEKILMREHINEGMLDKRVASWFDRSGDVLNEAEILLPSGEAKRPDRVIVYPDKVVVVDYKFGSRELEDKHRKQVLMYKNLVGEMGYKPVEGYLWYIYENYVTQV